MKNFNSFVLVLDVSNGCMHSCTGCKIDKQASFITQENRDNITQLLENLEQNETDFYEIEIGPTDLMSATNRDQIFSDPDFIKWATYFDVTTLSCAFITPIEQAYKDFAKQVHAFSPTKPVGVAVPIEMKHVFNDKYIDRLRKNIATFASHLPNKLKEVVLVVIFDEEYMNNCDKTHTYEELFRRVNELSVHETTMVDFAFHHGREKLTDENKAAFLKSIKALNEQYLLDLSNRGSTAKRRHIPSQFLPHTHNNELLVALGGTYIRPVLNERITVLDDYFKVNGIRSLADLVCAHITLASRGYDYVERGECRDCVFNLDCSSNYTHDLMAALNTMQCITIKRDIQKHHSFEAIIANAT